MFNSDELVGIVLNGFFQRNQKLIEESELELERLKTQSPVDYERKKRAEEELNQRYDFTVCFLDYGQKDGCFIAKGMDEFGKSGLIGRIIIPSRARKNNDVPCGIIFTKEYMGALPESDRIITRCETIVYHGEIERENNILVCRGEYIPKDTITDPKLLKGVWELRSK